MTSSPSIASSPSSSPSQRSHPRRRRSRKIRSLRPSYAVERILAWRRPTSAERVSAAVNRQPVPVEQFFVKWEGYDRSEGSWLTKKDFAGPAEPPMIAAFLRAHPQPFEPDWMQHDESDASNQSSHVDPSDYDALLDAGLPLSVRVLLSHCLATPEGTAAIMRLRVG